MRMLILGGTAFVGRTVVEAALSGGHEVTLFGRGKTGTELFPDVPRLVGDRDSDDYRALQGTSWDALVDVSAYVPRHVRAVAELLAERIGRYLFISSGAVYDWAQGRPGMDETSPRLPAERTTEEVGATTYGPLKVACEDDVMAAYGQRATIVRPGVVAGPYDSSDRFTYWVRRAAQGGQIELPGGRGQLEQPVQLMDSRDLANLILALLLDDRPGVYNAVGPAEPVTIAGLIHACAAAAGSVVEIVPVAEPAGGTDLPLVATDRSRWDIVGHRSSARARAVGLTATPLKQTAADVLAWDRARGEPPLHPE
jgi:2'-hydroxyisoflavone reductase